MQPSGETSFPVVSPLSKLKRSKLERSRLELSKSEIVFISSDLEGYQKLARQVDVSVEAVILNTNQDGIDRVTQALTNSAPLHRIHLFTNGTSGNLQLGTVALNFATLPIYANALYQWRSHLTPNAEILIYNCYVASNEAGKLLIDVLHHLTGAAIAACIELPNPTFRNGRWETDYATPSFTPSLAFPASVVSAQFPRSNHDLSVSIRSSFQKKRLYKGGLKVI
jgi:hypothetical protein